MRDMIFVSHCRRNAVHTLRRAYALHSITRRPCVASGWRDGTGLVQEAFGDKGLLGGVPLLACGKRRLVFLPRILVVALSHIIASHAVIARLVRACRL